MADFAYGDPYAIMRSQIMQDAFRARTIAKIDEQEEQNAYDENGVWHPEDEPILI